MQQIMRWGHDFLRIRGGGYLTSEPMGRSQVLIGEPINYQPPFLVLFTNHLILQGVSWAVIALGLGRCGQPSFLVGPSFFDHTHAQGESSHPLSLTWSRQLHSTLTHAVDFPHGGNRNCSRVVLPHSR